MRSAKVFLFSALMMLSVAVTAGAVVTPQQWIQDHVAGYEEPFTLIVGGEPLRACPALTIFYRDRDYLPAWTDGHTVLARADQLLHALQGAAREGLNPADYPIDLIDASIAKLRSAQQATARTTVTPSESQPTTTEATVAPEADPVALAELDVLLSQTFLRYAVHLAGWRFDQITSVDPEWLIKRAFIDPPAVLASAIASDRVEETLSGLLPTNPHYLQLREALARYRTIAEHGGWPQVTDTREGEHTARTSTLRARLIAEGFLSAAHGSGAPDEVLRHAVRAFQKAHGLSASGVVNREVLAALNVPVETRIRQIETNLERWRWLPRDLGQRHIVVNVAGYDLEVVEDGHTVIKMKVVVGTPSPLRRTPELSTELSQLVINPFWFVPPKIAAKEILPVLRRDPDYLAHHDMEIRYVGKGKVDPATIDWSQVTERNFPYRLRQRPGHKNPLGMVKFPLPNPPPFDDLYLHGTSQPRLFQNTERGFSHGCIRIENPIELMKYVLAPDDHWQRVINKPNQTLRLPRPIPVHILYWTAWVDDDGVVQFRKDVYDRDKLLDAIWETPTKANESAHKVADRHNPHKSGYASYPVGRTRGGVQDVVRSQREG